MLLLVLCWILLLNSFSYGLVAVAPQPTPLVSPLSLTLEELSLLIGGKGRAQVCWEAYRVGREPTLGSLQAQDQLQQFTLPIDPAVTTLHHMTTCQDGTIKLLLNLTSSSEGLQIETVIIPWPERQRSTVCISSQVGCRQACTFCLTGRMGLLRNLSVDEILSQVYWAQRIVHAQSSASLQSLPPIENIVFMGLGEPADNVDAVVAAAECLTDPHRFGLTPRRVTLSTVAPTPAAFAQLGQAPAVLAWSVHASRDAIRRQLVPTTKYSMVELRNGLVSTLQQGRSKRRRNVLLEMALLDHINDTEEDAQHLVAFCQPLLAIPGVRVIVNLIPWNDIHVQTGAAAQYRTPSHERVLLFQQYVRQGGMQCFIRTTRGDDELAACGQLSTAAAGANSRRRPIVESTE